MIKWKKLAKRIPFSIKTSKNDTFPVVFVTDFADGKTLGETRFDPPQIAILLGQSPKMTVITYLHEVLHAISYTHGANLTENQVLALEQSIAYILKHNNLFKEES